MKSSTPERHLAQNEVIFRQHNERITNRLEKLVKTATEDGNSLGKHADLPLHFYCECSDEKCDRRIIIKPSEYKKLHKNSSQFLILPGHRVASIERIVQENENFMVVEKYMTPPKKGIRLHRTDLENATWGFYYSYDLASLP